jgi:uncharacterized protein YcgL (UPF0745 family)
VLEARKVLVLSVFNYNKQAKVKEVIEEYSYYVQIIKPEA